jgi:hypothetical protein
MLVTKLGFLLEYGVGFANLYLTRGFKVQLWLVQQVGLNNNLIPRLDLFWSINLVHGQI